MSLVLVADDLTGASDAGVQFTKRGQRTIVWLDHGGGLASDGADVLVVDMDSRAIAAAEANARMRAFLARLGPRTPGSVIKKMDSTLRGNVGAELAALLDAFPDAFAVVCPAYPKNRRVVRDGALFVDGVPVDRTDFGRDLFSPVRDARVAAHLQVATATVRLETVRGGPQALIRAIDDARARGLRAAAIDAETDGDLIAIAALAPQRDDLLWVGSAGLIEALDLDVDGAPGSRPAVPRVAGPVAFLVGSISAMTQLQIDAFGREEHAERIAPVDALEERIGDAIERACATLRSGRDVLVALDGARPHVEAALQWGRERGLDAIETGRLLRTRFVDAARRCAELAAAVVLSGGDVARTFCERLGVRGMRLLAEAAPGIPLSSAIGAELLLVTKAGGFGRPETYREIALTLRSQVPA